MHNAATPIQRHQCRSSDISVVGVSILEDEENIVFLLLFSWGVIISLKFCPSWSVLFSFQWIMQPLIFWHCDEAVAWSHQIISGTFDHTSVENADIRLCGEKTTTVRAEKFYSHSWLRSISRPFISQVFLDWSFSSKHLATQQFSQKAYSSAAMGKSIVIGLDFGTTYRWVNTTWVSNVIVLLTCMP